VDRAALERLVALGYTQREVADALGCSQTTVRYWLRRWGLKTRPTLTTESGRAAREAGLVEMERDCKIHGPSRFVLDVQGYYRCTKCRADRVAERRRRVKEILVAEAGGRCVICGYDRHPAALEFHHRDPETKRFGLGASGLTRSIASMRAEAGKCDLLCSNCHAEVEAGFTAMPLVAQGVTNSGDSPYAVGGSSMAERRTVNP
jgi:DNA-binding transcriptional ArsR family regulator